LTFMFNIGVLFAKKTVLRMVSIVTAATVNVALNFLLIPKYGMMGAAWATLIGFLVQMVLTLTLSLRVFYVPYRYGRLCAVAGGALGIYAASVFLTFESLLISIPIKIACSSSTRSISSRSDSWGGTICRAHSAGRSVGFPLRLRRSAC